LRAQAAGRLEDQIATGNCEALELDLLKDFSNDPVKAYILWKSSDQIGHPGEQPAR
jgi:hypothetical protein